MSPMSMAGVFYVANTAWPFPEKLVGLSTILSFFLVAFTAIYYLHVGISNSKGKKDAFKTASLEDQLLVLDEAWQIFGAVLRREDMFRLVVNGIQKIFPFQSAELFIPDASGTRLVRIEASEGEISTTGARSVALSENVAGRSFIENRVVVAGAERTPDDLGLKADLANRPVAAIPLTHDGKTFAVLQLNLFSALIDAESHLSLFEAIGCRITPMIHSSLEVERSISNALTDPVTSLPNERAFWLILENQVAESQRKRERPLTVLAIDVKNIEPVRAEFGYTLADNLMGRVAELIKAELREMDFLASSGYEFLLVLPTASERVSWDIMARIQSAFFGNKIPVNEYKSISIEFNYGWASFWNDGESAEKLLKMARVRKLQAKSPNPQKVLWFQSGVVQ